MAKLRAINPESVLMEGATWGSVAGQFPFGGAIEMINPRDEEPPVWQMIMALPFILMAIGALYLTDVQNTRRLKKKAIASSVRSHSTTIDH